MIDLPPQVGSGAQPSRATVRAVIAPLLAGPRPAAPQVSQLLRGHQAQVVDFDIDWLRIRGADGYEGWCHSGYLGLDSSEPHQTVPSAWRSEQRMSIGCAIHAATRGALELPLGALLDADDEVTRGIAMNNRARLRYFAADAHSIVQRALEFFNGAPYLWGGVTPWGADCSGFVQTMFALHGTQLPRDAWMQAECGMAIANDVAGFAPADLLFFSDADDARPTHVALSMGESRCMHVSLANGGFGVNALTADDPVARHLRASFIFARRIL